MLLLLLPVWGTDAPKRLDFLLFFEEAGSHFFGFRSTPN